MVKEERIPVDYTPDTLIDLCSHAALDTLERSVFSFLLHVWNQYDFSLTLSDTLKAKRYRLGIWDDGHHRRTLGEPLRYF